MTRHTSYLIFTLSLVVVQVIEDPTSWEQAADHDEAEAEDALESGHRVLRRTSDQIAPGLRDSQRLGLPEQKALGNVGNHFRECLCFERLTGGVNSQNK